MTATVTSRVLAVLAVFEPARPLLTLTEIAHRAGLPLTTAHRLVGELARWGALERGPDGRYRVGLRLWEVATLAPRGLGLREAARRSTWSGCPGGVRCRSSPGSAAGCRCTRPGSGWSCWPTPPARCRSRSW